MQDNRTSVFKVMLMVMEATKTQKLNMEHRLLTSLLEKAQKLTVLKLSMTPSRDSNQL
jgi:hypothetical protein